MTYLNSGIVKGGLAGPGLKVGGLAGHGLEVTSDPDLTTKTNTDLDPLE